MDDNIAVAVDMGQEIVLNFEGHTHIVQLRTARQLYNSLKTIPSVVLPPHMDTWQKFTEE